MLISIFFMLACCNVMMCVTLEVRHSVHHFNFLFIANLSFFLTGAIKELAKRRDCPAVSASENR